MFCDLAVTTCITCVYICDHVLFISLLDLSNNITETKFTYCMNMYRQTVISSTPSTYYKCIKVICTMKYYKQIYSVTHCVVNVYVYVCNKNSCIKILLLNN